MPSGSPAPYHPWTPSPLRPLYRSLVQVYRLTMTLVNGAPTTVWNTLNDVLDPYVDVPGQLMCRLDLGFIRRGIDAPKPVVAGRAPDRVGVVYFDAISGPDGKPMVLAGDVLHCVSGPIYGNFEIRQIPDVAQNYVGAHHVETQVVEVAQQLGITTPTPFPGSEGPDS